VQTISREWCAIKKLCAVPRGDGHSLKSIRAGGVIVGYCVRDLAAPEGENWSASRKALNAAIDFD